MEWLTQFVPVWQAMLSLAALLWGASIILWRERNDMRGQIERMDMDRWRAERYINEQVANMRDDMTRASYDIGKLEKQVRELQTPLWKRWLRKIAA